MVAKFAFTPQTKIRFILRIKRRWMHSTGFVCYIPSLLALLLFLYSSFSEDLTVVRNYTIKIYWKPNNDVFFFLWISLYFCDLKISFAAFSLWIFLLFPGFWFWQLSFLLFISLRFIDLSLSHLPFLGYLTPSCVRFLNYLKEGEETLIWMFSFPEACRGGGR